MGKGGWVAVSAVALALVAAPKVARGCACGCGVFDVATSDMFPKDSAGMAFFEYDFSDQNRNWSGTSQAPAANNPDKRIETQFMSIGLQKMFNSSWGIQAQLLYIFRSSKTPSSAPGTPPVALNWGGVGRPESGGDLHRTFQGSDD